MLPHMSELPPHLALALERHKELLDQARLRREIAGVRVTRQDRLPLWRRWRVRAGELLILMGQGLVGNGVTSETPTNRHAPKTVWG